ncbi:MAG: Asp/Glu racemase [Rhodobacteraceae bacterium]|nr:Asp/Glu racemase [Paracoccaceae bacterium]
MKLPFSSDGGYGAGAAIGVVVLSTDETLEPELRQVTAGSGASLYHTRIPFDPVVTPHTLAQMEDELPASLRLLPKHTKYGAIGYGCTSGATIIGSARIAQIVHARFPGVAVSDPIAAVIAACRALGVKRLGMLTPYRLDVTMAMRDLLQENGITISTFGSFEEAEDYKVARITEQSTLEGLLQVEAADCDAVFASCTNLRSFTVIEAAEHQLGKPVISSNSAFVWHLHKIAGISGPVAGPGKLYSI